MNEITNSAAKQEQTMTLTERIKEQEARMEKCAEKWERARKAGHTKRAARWEIQYEVEGDALDGLLIEEMERDFEKAMSR